MIKNIRLLLVAVSAVFFTACFSARVDVPIDRTVEDGRLGMEIHGLDYNQRSISYSDGYGTSTLNPGDLITQELTVVRLSLKVLRPVTDEHTDSGPVVGYDFFDRVFLVDNQGTMYPSSAVAWYAPNDFLRGGIKQLTGRLPEWRVIEFRTSIRPWKVTLGILAPRGTLFEALQIGDQTVPLPPRPDV